MRPHLISENMLGFANKVNSTYHTRSPSQMFGRGVTGEIERK